jgi:DNA-binding NarL/FixJ family response regulator
VKKSILLVDDHPLILLAMRNILDRDFHVCGEARNGREAVKKAVELRPDLIVMDVSMPVMSGIDATRQIRQLLPDSKVVLLTMYDAETITPSARDAGADAVLTKGATLDEIAKSLAQMVAGNSVPVL